MVDIKNTKFLILEFKHVPYAKVFRYEKSWCIRNPFLYSGIDKILENGFLASKTIPPNSLVSIKKDFVYENKLHYNLDEFDAKKES